MAKDIFDRIIGHEKVCLALQKMVANNTLPHAILLVGPESMGKTLVAETLISNLIQSTNWTTHPDVSTIARLYDEKTEKQKTMITIDQIRELIARFSSTPIAGEKKIALIKEADKLHKAAANALLKTLEEPKGDSHLILVSASLESIPETICSRCQKFFFKSVSEPVMIEALKKRGLSGSDAKDTTNAAFGRPGLAIKYIEDSQFRAKSETALNALNSLIDSDLPERFKYITELLPRGESDRRSLALETLDFWESVLRQRLLSLKSIASDKKAIQALFETRVAISHNTNPQIALEHFFLNL